MRTTGSAISLQTTGNDSSRGDPQDMVLLVSYGSVVAPAATIRGSIAVNISFCASTTTRMLPASISSWKLRRIGSGSDEPTIAEAQQPTTAPPTVEIGRPAWREKG